MDEDAFEDPFARFTAKPKQTESPAPQAEAPQASDADTQPADSPGNDWQQKRTPKRTPVVIKTAPLKPYTRDRLVWAPNEQFTRTMTTPLVPARICDLHEAALEKNIQARIADDEVIVEFLCRDARDYRMAVVNKRKVYPYNEPYKPNRAEHASDGWHYKNMSRLQRIIRMGKSKYTLSDRENMFREMQRAAKAFLDCSLEPAKPPVFRFSRADNGSSSDDEGEDEGVYSSILVHEDGVSEDEWEDNQQTMADVALKTTTRVRLTAGNYIVYENRITKEKVLARILAVNHKMHHPLRLDNGEVLLTTELVKKVSELSEDGEREDLTSFQPISSFTLVDHSIEGENLQATVHKQTQEMIRDLEEQTGHRLNTRPSRPASAKTVRKSPAAAAPSTPKRPRSAAASRTPTSKSSAKVPSKSSTARRSALLDTFDLESSGSSASKKSRQTPDEDDNATTPRKPKAKAATTATTNKRQRMDDFFAAEAKRPKTPSEAKAPRTPKSSTKAGNTSTPTNHGNSSASKSKSKSAQKSPRTASKIHNDAKKDKKKS